MPVPYAQRYSMPVKLQRINKEIDCSVVFICIHLQLYKWERDVKKHIIKCQKEKDDGPKPAKPKRIYKCDVCGREFTGVKPSGYLKAHMRTHTGVKPFKCGICLKVYSFCKFKYRASFAYDQIVRFFKILIRCFQRKET